MRKGTRLQFEGFRTYELLRYYFKTDHPPRNWKDKDMYDELIRRGLTPSTVQSLVDDLYWAIGNATDNRLPWEDEDEVMAD